MLPVDGTGGGAGGCVQGRQGSQRLAHASTAKQQQQRDQPAPSAPPPSAPCQRVLPNHQTQHPRPCATHPPTTPPPACLPLVLFLSQPPSSVCMTISGMLSGSVQAAPLKATARQHWDWSGCLSYTLEPVYSAGSCRAQHSTAGHSTAWRDTAHHRAVLPGSVADSRTVTFETFPSHGQCRTQAGLWRRAAPVLKPHAGHPLLCRAPTPGPLHTPVPPFPIHTVCLVCASFCLSQAVCTTQCVWGRGDWGLSQDFPHCSPLTLVTRAATLVSGVSSGTLPNTCSADLTSWSWSTAPAAASTMRGPLQQHSTARRHDKGQLVVTTL